MKTNPDPKGPMGENYPAWPRPEFVPPKDPKPIRTK